MTRRDALLVLLLTGMTALVAPPLPASLGQDKKPPPKEKQDEGKKGKADGKKGKEKPAEKKPDPPKPKRTPERKALEAVGLEFKAEKAAALVKRMKRNGKLTLEFADKSGKNGPFKASQAKRVLEAWFAKRTIVSLKLDRVSGAVGSFKMKLRTKGKDKTVATTLRITLLKDGTRFYLHKIQEK